MKETTLFFIKPDAFRRKGEIKLEISNQFNIIYTKLFEFTDSLTREIYRSDIGKAHFPALLEYMVETPCEFGLIEGESALERFLDLAGHHSDPNKCAPHTLRFKYGVGLEKTKSGLYLIKNAIHRQKRKEELEEELNIFKAYHIL